MVRCLVTGGAGFIGGHLTQRLVALGHHVRVLDDFSTGKRSNLDGVLDSIELIEGDLRSPDTCGAACRGVEFVFHEGAIPSVPKSVDNPQDSHDVNVTGTFNILRAAVEQKVHRVIYAASSSAYGDTEVSPKHEGLPTCPLSPYAVQKLTGEAYARAFYECYGLETLSLRYFNVFGPRQDPKSQYAAAIPAFVTAILAGRPPVVYGDGEKTRDFTYIDNVVHANLLAMDVKKTEGQVVNAACGDRISVNEVIRVINRLLNTTIAGEHVPPRVGDVRHSCADVGRARTLLGFEPVVGFDEGLQHAIDYYRSIADDTE